MNMRLPTITAVAAGLLFSTLVTAAPADDVVRLPLPEIERVHGNDERILISDFVEATLQMHELVREVAGR